MAKKTNMNGIKTTTIHYERIKMNKNKKLSEIYLKAMMAIILTLMITFGYPSRFYEFSKYCLELVYIIKEQKNDHLKQFIKTTI